MEALGIAMMAAKALLAGIIGYNILELKNDQTDGSLGQQ
jgi:hypothetical protein